MNEYIIPEALKIALINYLAHRPYAEVHVAVAALQELKAAPIQDACKHAAENGYGAM